MKPLTIRWMDIVSILISYVLLFFPALLLTSQNFPEGSGITGNLQVDAQYYTDNDKLEINDSTLNYRRMGMNGFTQLLYNTGKFSAGLRMEAYLNPMMGFDPRYEGIGVPYWFASYRTNRIELTAGHFYEQFGSGLILRSWENWMLGYDNSLYGFNVRYQPIDGIFLKGLTGVHRYFWEPYKKDNRGIIRGLDAEIELNTLFQQISHWDTQISVGGSFVSKFENVPKINYTVDSVFFIDSVKWIQQTVYQLKLPHNVGAWSIRSNVSSGRFNFFAEYARKANDPNATNGLIYRKGSGLFSSLTYTTKGLGIYLSTKWIDNMSFKSRYSETGTPPMLDINYLPAISKEHVYSLAMLYPYATQPNGEFGFQGQLDYKIRKETLLGGQYGTTLTINYSLARSIKKDTVDFSPVTGSHAGTIGYKTRFFSIGDLSYYNDFSILIDRKISPQLKAVAGYYRQKYNKNVIEEGIYNDRNIINAHIAVLDVTYRFNPSSSLRAEAQGLWTKEDKGDWAALLLEYTIASGWFFSVGDEFNYGHPVKDKQIHYYNLALGYTFDQTRLSLRYGLQREGILCVGGVCRYVPASNGLSLTLISTF